MIENMEKIKEEVKRRLRSMGKHGDFEIEEVEQISFQPYSECFSGEGQRQWEAGLPHGDWRKVAEECTENSHLCLNGNQENLNNLLTKYNYCSFLMLSPVMD